MKQNKYTREQLKAKGLKRDSIAEIINAPDNRSATERYKASMDPARQAKIRVLNTPSKIAKRRKNME
jgi:hypothetical protein